MKGALLTCNSLYKQQVLGTLIIYPRILQLDTYCLYPCTYYHHNLLLFSHFVIKIVLFIIMSEVKKELVEEEVTAGPSQEQVMLGTSGEGGEEKTTSDSDSDIEFDDKFITQYCDSVDMPKAMTISKELFYTDKMVARHYEQLSDEDKARFDQMKVFAESIK